MGLAAIWLALPKPPLLEGIDFSQRVRDRNGNLLRVTLTADQKYRIWTPFKRPGQPAELTSAHVMLASYESSYTSGALVVMSDGSPIY